MTRNSRTHLPPGVWVASTVVSSPCRALTFIVACMVALLVVVAVAVQPAALLWVAAGVVAGVALIGGHRSHGR